MSGQIPVEVCHHETEALLGTVTVASVTEVSRLRVAAVAGRKLPVVDHGVDHRHDPPRCFLWVKP